MSESLRARGRVIPKKITFPAFVFSLNSRSRFRSPSPLSRLSAAFFRIYAIVYAGCMRVGKSERDLRARFFTGFVLLNTRRRMRFYFYCNWVGGEGSVVY